MTILKSTDNRVKWIKSDGTPLQHGAAAGNGAVYYGEIPLGRADGFAAEIKHDATEVSAFTLESSNDPSLDAYAAASDGWTSHAVALGTLSAASAAAILQWQVSDAEALRWRVKRDVTTGGVATLRMTAKGN